MAPSTDMDSFRKALISAKNVIAVAGAGLSAASGIPTFRGAGGMWRKFNAISLATEVAFAHNPSRVWQFYHYRREKAKSCIPNAAHHTLANFSLPTYRAQVGMPENSTFTLITQNVDGLSKRALDEVLRSSSTTVDDPDPSHPYMVEMHGRLFDIKCSSRECKHVEWNDTSPICLALGGTENFIENDEVSPISEKDLPRCTQCSALARPGVVWFGEIPHHLDLIDNLVEKADLCIVVGTSSTVYPAAGYAAQVRENGGKVAVFNLERSEGDDEADFLFLGPCEETLPEALREV